ncbi:MAG: LacI family DNA-binding transcriptional regulator [Clostridiales bacterium]|jgi:LacI family transcriptional regulator|nr:LacI family DNA-binding transcriptional regulator [Clostridiales bacterium]
MPIKKVTMRDIAQKLDVSVNAVSLALNDMKGISGGLRLKVLETADALGYFETSPRYGRIFGCYNFCILMQDVYANEMGFHGKVVYSVVQEAKNSGYDTILNYFDDANMIIPDCIKDRRVSGIIIIGKISNKNTAVLKTFNIHIVVINHEPMLSDINCILIDNKTGGYLATQYLLRAGFSKIGFFGDLSYSQSFQERYLGFQEALQEAFQDALIEENLMDCLHEFSITDKIEQYIIDNNILAIAKILSHQNNLPQAFFCSNDQAAVVLIFALRENGLSVPKDISVVGFDSGVLAEKITPKLTSVYVNKELMGYKAVRRLIHLIQRRKEEVEHVVLGVKLIERDSVAPISARR